MGTFNTKETLQGSPTLIPTIAEAIQEEFSNEGFEVAADALSSGGYDISITKGGFFKAILGMKTALKITLIPAGNHINFEAGVGIWGQQVIPTFISMLLFWPVIITQIWGMVSQAKLDNKALEIAQKVIDTHQDNDNQNHYTENERKFCAECGASNIGNARFCCECGRPF